MQFKRLTLCFVALVLIAPTGLGQRPPDPEVHIPEGMPINVIATRDETEQEITKYNVVKVVGPEVKSITMFQIMLGPGEFGPEFRLITSPARLRSTRYTTDKPSEPASIAWTSSVKVARLVIIVEAVETDQGLWILENPDEEAKSIISKETTTLPRAKFLKNK